MTLKASIDALNHDAGIWEEVAVVTATAATAVSGLALNESQLSWASTPTGLLNTYEEIRAKAARLLGEATTNFNDMSSTLKQVATAYSNVDSAAARRLTGIWDPKQ